ncbi:hypothetical protein AAG570_005532 [Ranatra chinensis]|uniref:Phenoloxidase-activating factor 2 n=1 Tax=Ranatra chinensis TaxID=642074 RepID=A0ABD0XYQ2_9HEMI
MSVLFKRVNGVNRFVCGASLIHPRMVITAAHCITSEGLGELRVRSGEWDLANTKEPLEHQERGVARLVIHQEYNNESLISDIALIVLDAPMDINPTVDTVCLAEPHAAFAKINTSACVVTGWGKNQFEGGKHQKILREVTLPIVERGECQRRLRETRLGKHFVLHESFICAGGSPEEDSCEGDGGGPLVCPILTDPNRYIQVGIVSWGIGCANTNPGVYVSVPNYFSWIATTMIDALKV